MIPVLVLISMNWLHKWGGLGLICVALVDSSAIPIPGGLDLMTAFLAAHNRSLWIYYALMSTAGSVLGGYLTYRVARKGGKETLDRRIPKDKLHNVERMFERWGFGAVLVSAILPPPFPTVPFLAGAGTLKYPLKKFISALALARAVRFTLIAYFASQYGRRFLSLLGRIHISLPFLLTLFAILAIAALAAYIVWRSRRSRV